jgi:flagellar hook-associated protein 1 FlgK
MDMGRQGIAAARAGLELVSRNIANASNPEYSRQEIFFESPLLGGVQSWSIRSQVDGFVEARINTESETQGRLEAERHIVGEVSAVFGTTDSGLDASLSAFFASVSALATSPESDVARTQVLFQGDALTAEFQREANALVELSTQVGTELESAVSRVNQLSRDIAQLNGVIGETDSADGSVGQLKDQRASLVKEMATLVDINSFEDGDGNVTVFVAGGVPLVEGGNAYDLTLTPASGYDPTVGVGVINPSGARVDITSRVQGGEIGGLLRIRDQVLAGAAQDLDRIAGALVLNFNQAHAQGFGLDGSTGNDFFSPLSASSVGKGTNTGGADVGASIIDPSAVTLDDYEVVFTSPAQFDIKNVTQGTTVSSGNAYVSGMTVDVDGVRLTLSDVSGAPQAGDSFRVSTTDGQALNVSRVLAGGDQLAAAQSAAGVPGDNRNALVLSGLETDKLMDNGTLSLGEKFGQVSGRVGLEQQSVEQAYEAQSLVMQGLQNRRAEVSAVSMDEEAAKLIQFQQAFEASARMIRVADELARTIINMV